MTNKTCVTCGGELKFNRSNGFFECTFCGKIHTTEGKDKPLSLAIVDQHMHTHQFQKAQAALDELRALEPNNPIFVLRNILIQFRMTSAGLLLSCAKSNSSQLESILACPDWDTLRQYLPDQQSHFVDDLKEYCSISLQINELKHKIKLNEDFLSTRDRRNAPPATLEKNTSSTPAATEKDSKVASTEKDASSSSSAAENNAGPDNPEKEGRGFIAKIKSKLPAAYNEQMRIKEESAMAEIAADKAKSDELEARQQALLAAVKELESEL